MARRVKGRVERMREESSSKKGRGGREAAGKGLASISRRGFVSGAALAAAALALEGCASEDASMKEAEDSAPVTEGEWRAAYCTHHCLGHCALRVYMVDGVPIRTGTDNSHEDSAGWPQRRACSCGRSRLYDYYGTTRLKYPMKRKSWQPGGGENSHGELRGIDEWERISWDEALDMIADEMKRIRDEYGNRSILGLGLSKEYMIVKGNWGGDHEFSAAQFGNVLCAFGGFVDTWGTSSGGSTHWAGMLYGRGSASDRFTNQEAEYAILIGQNPAVSCDGASIHATLRPIAEAGCKFYIVDPMYNETCAALGATWVPIRPGTDKALLLGMAHVMLAEDDPETNPLIDWEFLDKYCIGFDADHMPEGANPQDNFKDYVLGTYDGVAKTPEWAEAICGVPADTIVELGRVMGKENKTILSGGYGPARHNNTETYCQAVLTVGAMGGHWGKPGHYTALEMGSILNGTGSFFKYGKNPNPQLENPVDDNMPHTELWEDILQKKYPFTGGWNQTPVEMRDIDIKCIYHYSHNPIGNHVDMADAIEAFRSVDLVVSNQYTLQDTARYADFVLPVTVGWEHVPGLNGLQNCADYAVMGVQITEPMYECKDYRWIGEQLLERWGIDSKDVWPVSREMVEYTLFADCQILAEDGSGFEPFLSFTEEEAALFGPEAQPREEGRISFTEFSQMGVYHIQRSKGDAGSVVGSAAFVEDPETNKMSTESGKIEIYSKTAPALSSTLISGDSFSYIPPIASYVPTKNGYEDTFSDYEAGVKNDTPYQLLSAHYQRSKHSTVDNVPVQREAFSRPVFIATQDAAEKGIEDGDVVRVFNEKGSVLRHAYVTNRLMPGVVDLPHGAMVLVDPETGFNISGSCNWVSYPATTGLGAHGYYSQRCNIEKWDGELPEDVDMVDPTPDFQQANALQDMAS